jgi:hypothetical protein
MNPLQMKITSIVPVLMILAWLAPASMLYAQKYGSAGEYMSVMSAESDKIQQASWAYTSQVAHSKNARKVDKKRQELLTSVLDSRRIVNRLPDYEGDASLRDSVKSFLAIQYAVLNQDYEKILDLEEIAEQSYDLMEAYMLAKQKAQDKLRGALDNLILAQQSFADAHNVNLVSEESEMDNKVKIANEVIGYHRVHYLIFFKCSKQEMYLVDAAIKGDVNEMEQNANSLSDFSNEGLAKLPEVSNFKGDRSMAAATEELLKFWKVESEKDFPAIIDFQLLGEKLKKSNSDIEKTKTKDRTQEMIDRHNGLVKDYNEKLAAYNATQERLNKERAKLFDDWQKASAKFLDKQVPK